VLIRAMVNDVPSKFKASTEVTTLFCSTCQSIVTSLNHSYHDDSANFDIVFGFRLDSAGKKIRKQSDLLKISVAMESVCADFQKKIQFSKTKKWKLILDTA